MSKSILILLLLSLTHPAMSQNDSPDCKCCTEEHKQFDFWLGEWDVFDMDGKLVGSNTIVSLQDHCVLQENWKSEQMTGTSYNYYDSKTLEWKQLWLDNQGGTLDLSGSFQKGKMVLKSRIRFSSDGTEEVFDEISWEYNADGTVTQTWLVRSVGGKVLNKVFVGIYKPKS